MSIEIKSVCIVCILYVYLLFLYSHFRQFFGGSLVVSTTLVVFLSLCSGERIRASQFLHFTDRRSICNKRTNSYVCKGIEQVAILNVADRPCLDVFEFYEILYFRIFPSAAGSICSAFWYSCHQGCFVAPKFCWHRILQTQRSNVRIQTDAFDEQDAFSFWTRCVFVIYSVLTENRWCVTECHSWGAATVLHLFIGNILKRAAQNQYNQE